MSLSSAATGVLNGRLQSLDKVLDQIGSLPAIDFDAVKAAEVVDSVTSLLVKAQDTERRLQNPPKPEIWSFDGLKQLSAAIMSQSAEWMKLDLPALDVPAMITTEEMQYFYNTCSKPARRVLPAGWRLDA